MVQITLRSVILTLLCTMGVVVYASSIQRQVPHPQQSGSQSYFPEVHGRDSSKFSKLWNFLQRKKSPDPMMDGDNQLIDTIKSILKTQHVRSNDASWLKTCLRDINNNTRAELRHVLQEDQKIKQVSIRRVLYTTIEDCSRVTVGQVGRVVALSSKNPWMAALLLSSSYLHFWEITNVEEKELASKQLANVLTVAIYLKNEAVVKYLLEFDSREEVYQASFLVGRYILAVHWQRSKIAKLLEEHQRLNGNRLSPRLNELREKYLKYNDGKEHVFDGIPDLQVRKELGFSNSFRYSRMVDESRLPMPLIVS